MTDPESFERTIVENPADDAPRLVYADWLEEQGDPRGEFIRIQCALARLEIDDERRPALTAREHALLVKHGKQWPGKLKSLTKDYCFRRGFIEWVSLPGRQFLTDAARIFELAPIRQLRLTHLGMGRFPAAELAQIEQLQRIDALELAGRAGDERIETIVRSKYIQKLTRLQLDDTNGGERALAVVLGGAMPKLDRLEVIGDGWMEIAHFASRAKIALRELLIRSPEGVLDRDRVIQLARAKTLGGLRFLDLRNSNAQVTGATALANSKVLTQLEVLGLKRCAVGVNGMKALGESGKLDQLKVLNLEGIRFGINGLTGLLAARCENLIGLNLSNNELDERCIPLLRAWSGLKKLRYLDLANNPIPDKALAELIAAPETTQLWHLELGPYPPENATKRALAERPHLAGSKPHVLSFSNSYRHPRAHSGTSMNIL